MIYLCDRETGVFMENTIKYHRESKNAFIRIGCELDDVKKKNSSRFQDFCSGRIFIECDQID